MNVKVEGNIIPTVRYLRILGVFFDTFFYFATHATNVDAKVKRRNKVLKALAFKS